MIYGRKSWVEQAPTRIFRARIDRLSDFYPIFVSCAFTWFIYGNLITFLSYFSGTKFIGLLVS